ncbi:pilin [Patescibacteria group bacterium]|nr:pilin [Patescibacteria group bacterium]
MKKNIFKKLIVLTCLTFLLFGFLAPVHFSLAITCEKAPTCISPSVVTSDGCSCTYVLLAPLPDDNGETIDTFDPTAEGSGALGDYLNIMIKLFIGICAVLAVIMIVMGGIEYMTTELISGKEAGKERILHAIFGLLLALSAWTLLYTINPNLLNVLI